METSAAAISSLDRMAALISPIWAQVWRSGLSVEPRSWQVVIRCYIVIGPSSPQGEWNYVRNLSPIRLPPHRLPFASHPNFSQADQATKNGFCSSILWGANIKEWEPLFN